LIKIDSEKNKNKASSERKLRARISTLEAQIKDLKIGKNKQAKQIKKNVRKFKAQKVKLVELVKMMK
jgi:hypothetical protein